MADEEAFPSSGKVSSSALIKTEKEIKNIRGTHFIVLKKSIIFIDLGIIIEYFLENLRLFRQPKD